MLAQGMPLDKILPQLDGVCEGVPTARAAHLDTSIPEDSKPIVTQLHAILYEGRPSARGGEESAQPRAAGGVDKESLLP